MRVRYVAALLSCVMPAACGSASDATTFKAPATYTQAVSFGPFVQMWKGPDDKSIIMLMALPMKSSVNDAMKNAQISQEDVKVHKTITICNGQQAMYFDAIGKVDSAGSTQNPHPGEVETVFTSLNGKTYVAMYVRPLSVPADPAADAAIHDICPAS
jgi:hypothetical protein